MNMDSNKTMSFSKEMRVATRDIHNVSDSLVNAKLAFALYDSTVWAEGLLVFYDIFKYLEQNVSNDFLPEEYHRTQQFEEDLEYYLGKNWKVKHQPRKEVADYIKYLEKVRNENSNLMVPYVYHLYMGLLSGGQILQKRRNISKKLNPFASNGNKGSALTTFDGHSIFELKQKMRKNVDDFGVGLDEETRKQMIDESRKVFEMNNTIIKTVKGVNKANLKILCYIFIIIVAYLILKYFTFK